MASNLIARTVLRARRMPRWVAYPLLIIVALVVLTAASAYAVLAAGDAQLSGHVALNGLSAPVTITRDARGVPTIHAANEIDAVRALGFLHAQTRFFQMDLLRRSSAGQLAALLGAVPGIVAQDKRHRRFRMQTVAQAVLAQMPMHERALVGAYTLGVNDGLNALSLRPFQYLLLGQKPHSWQPQDCVLVAMSMYFMLQDADASRELKLAKMRTALPKALFQFITPKGTQWDSPMRGKAYSVPTPPAAEVFDLRQYWQGDPQTKASQQVARRSPVLAYNALAGSNSWAVSGRRSASGHVLVANDIHLHLSVPALWYRARLIFKQIRTPHQPIDALGVTLPGVPGIIAGSNGFIAWGLTNAHGDWSDLISLLTKPDDPNQYLTPDGWTAFKHYDEVIHVRDGADVHETVRTTIWGPVVGTGPDGHLLAVHWVGAQPTAINFQFWNLLNAQNVSQALSVATRSGLPEVNFVVGDTQGHIGWTLAGHIPNRIGGYDSQRITSWATGQYGWQGWVSPHKHPRIVNPDNGLIWTANNRVLGGAAQALLGNSGDALGARAQQIHADLKNLKHATLKDMLQIQTDDRARFLQRWQKLLLKLITPKAIAHHPARAQFRVVVSKWGARASVDSVGYRLVREFHAMLRQRVLKALLAPVRARFPNFKAPRLPQFEGALWALVQQQPDNLLNPEYSSWRTLMLSVVDAVMAKAHKQVSNMGHYTWGRRNRAHIQNPLSVALPWLAPILDMSSAPLPGDRHMPRVQAPSFGASMRMAVEVGQAFDGVFELPGGQSANPVSSYYSDEFKAWVKGQPAPFKPGAVEHTLTLVPMH